MSCPYDDYETRILENPQTIRNDYTRLPVSPRSALIDRLNNQVKSNTSQIQENLKELKQMRKERNQDREDYLSKQRWDMIQNNNRNFVKPLGNIRKARRDDYWEPYDLDANPNKQKKPNNVSFGRNSYYGGSTNKKRLQTKRRKSVSKGKRKRTKSNNINRKQKSKKNRTHKK